MDRVTARLRLRELTLADAPALHAIESDARVTRYMSYDPQSPEQIVAYIHRQITDQTAVPRTCFDLGITLRESGALIGRCGLKFARPEHREAAIWYLLAPQHWRNGYAGEAVGALLSLAFDALGAHRVWADCDPRNAASCRLAQRLGLKLEGRLRENYFLKGEWCDTFVYAVLEDEWRAAQPGGST